MRFVKTAWCVLSVLAASPSLANNIVLNGSFEGPVVTTYNGTTSVSQNADAIITNWGLNGLDGGVFKSTVPDGNQGAYIDVGSSGTTTLYQDLGVLTANTTYTLSLFSQQTGDQPAIVGSLTASLATGAGGQKSVVVNTAGLTIGNSVTLNPASTFASVGAVAFTTGSSVSGDLYVLLAETSSHTGSGRQPQIYVDNVVVSTVAVPEPRSLALLGVGSLSVLAVRRRRNVNRRPSNPPSYSGSR